MSIYDPRPIREDAIHEAIIILLRLKALPGTIFYHPANGLPARPRTIKRFKERFGMYPGVADICLVRPGGQACFLEIKTPDGRQSIAQKGFQLHAEANGADYRIARSVSEAESIFSEWGILREARTETRRAA